MGDAGRLKEGTLVRELEILRARLGDVVRDNDLLREVCGKQAPPVLDFPAELGHRSVPFSIQGNGSSLTFTHKKVIDMISRAENQHKEKLRDMQDLVASIARERDEATRNLATADYRISALIDEMKELEELRLQENRQAALESEAREADRQLDMRREQDRAYLVERNLALQERLRTALSLSSASQQDKSQNTHTPAQSAQDLGRLARQAARHADTRSRARAFSAWSRVTARAQAVEGVLRAVSIGVCSQRMKEVYGRLQEHLRYKEGRGAFDSVTAYTYQHVCKPVERGVLRAWLLIYEQNKKLFRVGTRVALHVLSLKRMHALRAWWQSVCRHADAHAYRNRGKWNPGREEYTHFGHMASRDAFDRWAAAAAVGGNSCVCGKSRVVVYANAVNSAGVRGSAMEVREGKEKEIRRARVGRHVKRLRTTLQWAAFWAWRARVYAQARMFRSGAYVYGR